MNSDMGNDEIHEYDIFDYDKEWYNMNQSKTSILFFKQNLSNFSFPLVIMEPSFFRCVLRVSHEEKKRNLIEEYLSSNKYNKMYINLSFIKYPFEIRNLIFPNLMQWYCSFVKYNIFSFL